MSYIPPEKVTSPKGLLSSIDEIIHSDGEGSWVIASLTYDEKSQLGIRWNGTNDRPLGYPSVRNYPVWFIVPEFFAPTVKYMAEEKAAGREVGLPLSTEELAGQLKSKGYKVTLEM
jgi:hypothetical protein